MTLAHVQTSHGPVAPTHAAAAAHQHTINLPAAALAFGHLFAVHLPSLRSAMVFAGMDLSNPQKSIDTLIESYVASKYAAEGIDPELKAAVNGAIESDVQLAKVMLKKYAVGSAAGQKVETTLEQDAKTVLASVANKYPSLAGLANQLTASIPAPVTTKP